MGCILHVKRYAELLNVELIDCCTFMIRQIPFRASEGCIPIPKKCILLYFEEEMSGGKMDIVLGRTQASILFLPFLLVYFL